MMTRLHDVNKVVAQYNFDGTSVEKVCGTGNKTLKTEGCYESAESCAIDDYKALKNTQDREIYDFTGRQDVHNMLEQTQTGS